MEARVIRWRRMALANVWGAAAYLACGWLSYVAARDSALQQPLNLAAALALAMLASFGWRLLPGLAAGVLLLFDPRLSPAVLPLTAASSAAPTMVALLLGGAALLQAVFGAAVLRRHVDLALAAGGDVLRFVLLTPLLGCIRASLGLGALAHLGAAAPDAAHLWLAWWAADTTAVLLGAPLCWVAFGQPRDLWRARRLSVALPLAMAGAVFVVLHHETLQWEQSRHLQTFRLKAQEVGQLLQAAMHEHERYLIGVARALEIHGGVESPHQFAVIARPYLRQRPELLAMAWLPRVPHALRAAFERERAMERREPFGIVDFTDAGTASPAPERNEYYPVLYAEPNPERLLEGGDFLSEPLRAATLGRAMSTGAPAASAPVLLPRYGRLGIHLLQMVGGATGPPLGALDLALRIDTYVESAMRASGFPDFQLELDDVSSSRAPVRMLDTIGVNYHPPDHRFLLAFGGRDYLLRLAPAPAYLAGAGSWQRWSVQSGGVLLAGLIAALMLVLSGERAKVQAQVDEATLRLRERESRLQAILDHAGDAIVTVDQQGILLTGNPAAARLFRCKVDQLPGQSLGTLLVLPPGGASAALACLAEADLAERELEGVASTGERFPLLISVSPVWPAGAPIFVCIMHDLTEQRRAQAHIYQLAHRDALTGLENRLALNEHLEQLLAQARRAGTSVALLFMDLDHFKKINDSQGHQAGDLLLVEVAQRLRELLRDVDIIGRLGGDEFIVAMSGKLNPELVSAVALRVVHALSKPYLLNGKTVHSGASVGIAMFPADADSGSTLLRHADLAMYEAKSAGRGNFRFFSAGMNAAIDERLALEQRLRLALGRREFELYLQPQVNLASARVIGAEALLRWHQPEVGLVMPAHLIPVAEESGLILPLGDWILEEAIGLLAQWQRQGMHDLRLAINLSARQCHARELLPRLDALLQASQVAPNRLEVEIAESAAMQDPETTRVLLRQLRERGIRVAIDDFGTGCSSLSYLKLFALDRIKIDRGIVTDIESDPDDAAIVSATISLAHALGMPVIAEGVETLAQRRFLQQKRCDEAQGFLFGPPMTAAHFHEFVGGPRAPGSTARAPPAPGP